MAAGAFAQAAVAVARAGEVYGADQVQYGLVPLLGSAAGAALLAGLVLVAVVTARTVAPGRLRDLLRGPEWAALAVYVLAVGVTGNRAGMIAPVVFLAWAYSAQVRTIPLRRVAAGAVAVLAVAGVIGAWRTGSALPDSPAAVIRSAAGDVSSPAWITAQTAARVPSQVPYSRGSTYAAAVVAQVPGPVARRLGATSRTASARFRDLIGFSDPDQGFAESYPSEAYLNFGLPGCMGAGLFLGAVMGWAWRRCRVKAGRPRDLLYPVLLAGLAYGLRSDALTQVKDALYPLLAVWAVMGWCRVPAVARSVQRAPERQLADTAAGQ
jgi:hypothetical protein